MTYLIVTSAFLLLFLAMIVVGFVRFRKPESGWLLIIGFLGVTGDVYLLQGSSSMFRLLVSEGIIDFSVYKSIYGLIVAFFFIPILCPFILLIIGWANNSHPYSQRFKEYGAVVFLIAVWFVGTSSPSWIRNPDDAAEAEVKSYIHLIQIALERYAVDTEGYYPEKVDNLIDDYLLSYPINPFSTEPMRDVPYGSPEFEGNYTYLPVWLDGEIREYYLIGYGYRTNPGQHLVSPDVDDHVIIVLDGGSVGIPFPEIKDVIQSAVMTEF